MTDTDNALRGIISAPVESIADVIAVMEGIDGALPDSDGLKWFNWLYLTVTKAVDQSVGGGVWERPEFIARLDVVFARLYFSAVSSSLEPAGSPPECWRVFFNARNDARLARIQFALAGMNAHIDRDLAVAVVETCKAIGIAPRHGSPEYRDFTKVDDLLDTLIDQTKEKLGVGLLGDEIPALGQVEDLIAAAGMRAARQIAWANAEVLFGLDASLPGLAERFLAGLDRPAALAGQAVLTFSLRSRTSAAAAAQTASS